MTDPSSFSAQTFFDVHACGEQLKPMGVSVDLAHLVRWARLICHDAGLGADALTQPGATRRAVMAAKSPESAGMVLAALDLFSTLLSIPECGQALADPQATKPKAAPAAEPGLYDSVARIEILLTKEGRAYLKSQFMGEFDSSYAYQSDRQLLGVVVPELLADLRAQIQESFGSATTS
jgi:hypothetical protein